MAPLDTMPSSASKPAHIIIGITGASGAVYGIRLLEILRDLPVYTHLVITRSARLTIPTETDYSIAQVQDLADEVHPLQDVGACIASGSYPVLGMIVAPCSMRSLGEIAHGMGSNLLTRAADVCLKERRKLVLMVRETPLHTVHLRNMAQASELGAIIAPPVPAFYSKPKSLADMVDHTLGRVLDLFDLNPGLTKPWQGLPAKVRLTEDA